MKRAIFIIFSMIVGVAGQIQASDPATAFSQANTLSAKTDWDKADALYAQIETNGHYHADLYFNRGLNSYNAEDFGRAALYFWRARLLEPDPSTDKALAAALDKLPGSLSPTQLDTKRMSGQWGGVLVWAGTVLFWLGLVIALFLRTRLHRTALIIGSLLALLGILTATGGRALLQRGPTPASYWVTADTKLHSAPSAKSRSVGSLDTGTLVRMESRVGQWCFVKSDLRTTSGWANTATLEPVVSWR